MTLLTTSEAVKKYMENRLTMVTEREDVSDFFKRLDDSVKPHTFVVASVAKINVAEVIRKEINGYILGEQSLSDCTKKLNRFLEDEFEDTVIRASKIRFIVQNDYLKACGVGQYFAAMQPEQLEDSPYFKYVATLDDYARASHTQYNGLVLPKTDAFWDTHFPPWDFNCRCMVDQTHEVPKGAEQNRLQKLADQTRGKMEAQSGFAFNPRTLFEDNDITKLEPKTRVSVMQDMEKMMKDSGGGRCTFVCQEYTGGMDTRNVVNPQKTAPIFYNAEDEVKKIFKANNVDMSRKTDYIYMAKQVPMPKLPPQVEAELPQVLSLGKLNNRLAEAAGTSSKPVKFSLVKNDDFGFRHEWIHHKEFFEDAEYGLQLLNDTLGYPGCRVTKTYTYVQGEVQTRILLHNIEKNSVCVLREIGGDFEVCSVHELSNQFYPDDEAKVLQNKKNTSRSIAQNGIQSTGIPEINIPQKSKFASQKSKKGLKK